MKIIGWMSCSVNSPSPCPDKVSDFAKWDVATKGQVNFCPCSGKFPEYAAASPEKRCDPAAYLDFKLATVSGGKGYWAGLVAKTEGHYHQVWPVRQDNSGR